MFVDFSAKHAGSSMHNDRPMFLHVQSTATALLSKNNELAAIKSNAEVPLVKRQPVMFRASPGNVIPFGCSWCNVHAGKSGVREAARARGLPHAEKRLGVALAPVFTSSSTLP